MRLHDQALSEEEFEQLPPALRRKYFSSLERLRLAQDANHGCSSHRSTLGRSPARTSNASSRRNQSISSTGSIRRSLSVVCLSPVRARSHLRKASRQAVSPSTVLVNPWEFAALPAAIRRKHFSPEEQYYIASRVNPVILDAADEALYKQYQLPRQPSTADSTNTGLEEWDDELSDEEDTPAEMDAKDLESFRWLDNDNDLDLRLDDYHAINAVLNSHHVTSFPRQRSFRRGLSFSNVSFRRRSSSSTSLRSPPPAGSSFNKALPPPTLNLASPVHKRLDSASSLDPSATHYQDPAAKMKLRVYLASPQKFDEALEFGFPTLHKDAVQSPARPKTSPGVVDGQPKTFFADDTPSLSDDESRDERSEYLCQDSPRTPIDMSFPGRPSHKSSTERSSQLRPRVVHHVADGYAQASASDREMTLRMTLTRPELRALEQTEHSKPSLVNYIPLERAPLTVPVDNARSIWDELPEEPSRVKRFFKKLKGKA